ncbi:S-adenosyl-L-methionine-dependent methyltransferase [Cercophora newfieldiana]|uniref:S-adenosyl-L-methionine-dependent methyltransferase n=1 Tax=Cercophora newfieldiana TaxID=92897 RepID=A0AA39XT89_9PEZI|nr:S-adenosyl-L-methionine-dependent methyltransferase [Cercophora newfieldiana]
MAPSQYDAIGDKYKVIKALPTALVDKSNLHAAIAPHIQNARALDLACGTGFFSRLLLTWGASSVLGIDLSPAMISVAQREASSLSNRLSFLVSDATTLGYIDPTGPAFDHAIGAWLLHYAADEDQLTRMFTTVSSNLDSPTSVFVGIASRPVPQAEMDAFANSEKSQTQLEDFLRVKTSYYARNERVEGGWCVKVTSVDDEAVKFRNYHLPTEVYERAARKGGMCERLEWREVKLHEDVREEAIREFGREFWDVYFEVGPHFGLLVVEKGV